ncbi:MAG: hypothetical protein ACJ8GO_03000 [Ramlibacter sp.]
MGVARSRLAAVAAGGKVYAIGGFAGGGRGAAEASGLSRYHPASFSRGRSVWTRCCGSRPPSWASSKA